MNKVFASALALLLWTGVSAQSDLQQLYDAERAFDQAAAEKGMKSAFLDVLSDDSVVFRPSAVNGKEFWRARNDPTTALLIRVPIFADISSNGLLGYTTGNWEFHPQGKGDARVEYGQYVTVWEKRPDGKFRATLDMVVTHEKLSPAETNQAMMLNKKRELNKRGWSVADASMNFLRMSMSRAALGGAYKKFAAKDVRLLRDREPPILGKKNAVAQTRRYTSIAFPTKVSLLQSGDLAYAWNPCEFANSNEGIETGNCLQIWKLRDKKWWIVLGAFARVPNEKVPELKTRPKTVP